MISLHHLRSLFTTSRGRAVASATLVLILAAGAGSYILQRSGIRSVPFTQYVSAQGDLRMEFPENMNERSVEENLVQPSDIKGTIKWDGGVLVYHPESALTTGGRYVFQIDQRAQKSGGGTLGRDLTFTFIVSGAPTVSAQIPGSGALSVPSDTRITIIFDRPFVPLMQVQGARRDQLTSDWPVRIDPPTPGRWRWLSTYAAEFIPKDGLTLSTSYHVSVPSDLVTANGEKTVKDFSWSFETARPTLVSSDPEPGDNLAGPTTTVALTFNQDMDPKRALAGITLLQTASGSLPPPSPIRGENDLPSDALLPRPSSSTASGRMIALRTIRTGETTDEKGKKIPDPKTLVLVPATPLSLHTSYMVVIKNLQGSEGTLANSGTTFVPFSTVGTLSVDQATFEYGSLRIFMSNPMPTEGLDTFFSIDPKPEGDEATKVNVNEWGDKRELSLYPSLKPSTSYTLTISAKIADAYGQTLGKPYTTTFKTPRVDPQVNLESKGDLGIFERGKAPITYTHAVNVSRLDVEFAPLAFGDFLARQLAQRTGESSAPVLSEKEGYRSWQEKPKNALDQWETTSIDLEKRTGSTLTPGLYAVSVHAPEYTWQRNDGRLEPVTLTQYFAITNLALTLKHSGNRALVWVTDMQTGDPVSGAAITFHTLSGTTPVTGTTDAQGFFETKLSLQDFKNVEWEWMPQFFVTAEKAGDIAFVGNEWNGGMRPEDFSLPSDFRSMQAAQDRLSSYLYTERPLYAAGDTVNFKGILRIRTIDGKLRLPASAKTAKVTVSDDQGRTIYEKSLPISPFGSFSDSLSLDASASLGTYAINAYPEGDVPVDYNASAAFSVLAYRKPTYRVEVETKTQDAFSRDRLTFDLAGSYYFGAPLAGAKVTWRADTTDYYFNRFTDGWYSFSAEEWCWWNCQEQTKQLTEGQGFLDAAGKMQVSFPVTLDEKSLSQIITLEADVTDPSNQVVSNSASAFIHRSNVYVGIRSQDYVVTPGQEAHADVVTVKPDGSPISNQEVTVQLFSRTWSTVRKKGVDGMYYYDNTPEDTYVSKKSLRTNKDGKGTIAIPIDRGGEFRLVAVAKDDAGREASAGTSIYSWSTTYVNWPHSNNDKITIEADKPEYAVGDTAVLLVQSPFQGKGVKALVTVERENVIRKEIIDVSSNAQPLKIPITEDLIPNAYVSVVILKPRVGETFDDQGKDTGAPSFKIGYVKLNVETKLKELSVSLTTDKASYGPGEKVTANFAVKDSAGKPVHSELSLGVVDMSLLALSGFGQPDLVRTFWSEQGLGVFTSASLTHLLERYKPGSKGGGGGDFEARKRGSFKDTAYWNPSIVTDAEGKASVTFTLPDNLTTWKLLTLAHTKESTFGSASMDILETKQVILQQVRPRFAIHGDRVTVGALVTNQLPRDASFAIRMSGSGFALAGKSSITVTIPHGAQKKVLFPVIVGNGESTTFNLRAETEGARDEVEEKMPLYVYGVPQSVATSAVTEQGVTEKVIPPSEAEATDGSLTLTFSPSIATYLPAGLDYLARYPYGCTEQTVSSFLPSVALKSLQGFSAFAIADDAKLNDIVQKALQKLYGNVRPDGGFGFWKESDHSDAYLTAYVLFALNETKKAGYAVDASVVQGAVKYLQSALRSTDTKSSFDLATRTFILFALSESGHGDAQLLRNMVERRSSLPLFAQAQLSMALQDSDDSGLKAKAAVILKEILSHARINARGTHFEEEQKGSLYDALMHTNERTTALVLQAMVRIDPQSILLPNVTRYLLAVRKEGHWDSTQSTTYALLALTDYLRSTKELDASFTAVAKVNGKEILTQTFGAKNILTRSTASMSLDTLKRGVENTLEIGKQGTGRLYYDALLSYFYTPDSVQPAEEGMSILREMATLEGGDASTMRVGETYRVTLTITVPEDRRFVAVESPLPAGLEIIDFNFQTTQQHLRDELTKTSWWTNDPWSRAEQYFFHREYRDDRVFLSADDLPTGVYKVEYLVRATTPGTFQERPARTWEMYFPETFGQTSGRYVTVQE